MKKNFYLISALSLTISLFAACGSENTESKDSAGTEANEIAENTETTDLASEGINSYSYIAGDYTDADAKSKITISIDSLEPDHLIYQASWTEDFGSGKVTKSPILVTQGCETKLTDENSYALWSLPEGNVLTLFSENSPICYKIKALSNSSELTLELLPSDGSKLRKLVRKL